MTPVHFTTGLSDFFQAIANGNTAFGNDTTQINQMFDRVLDYNARTLRVAVYWNEVEQTPGTYTWTGYEKVIDRALERNLRILPMVWSAPENNPGVWGFPTKHAIKSDGSLGVSYPYTQAGYDAYGRFVADTLSYFGSRGVSRAVEVWNEPNLTKYLGVDAEYKKMLNAALAATKGRTYGFNYTVISGGLSQSAANWQAFMYDFTYYNQCFTPYSVGIHPYAYKPSDFPETMDRTVAIDNFVERVQGLYNEAKNLWGGDLWVTEFGCPSIEPFGRVGRSGALERLVGTTGFFESRERCKAVFLYRLLPQNFSQDDTPLDGPFATYPLLKLTNVPPNVPPYTFAEEMPVQGMLYDNWSGAPFVP